MDDHAQQVHYGKTLVIFDWSGTLSDDRLPVFKANDMMLSFYGITIETMAEWLSSGKSNAYDYAIHMGVVDSRENIDRLYNLLFEHVVVHESIAAEVYPYSRSTLEKMVSKGIEMSVISAHPQASLDSEVQRYQFSEFFTEVVGSVYDKAESIEKMVRDERYRGYSFYYVGDCIGDIIAAKKAGVVSVAVCDGYHSKTALESQDPDIVLPDVSFLVEKIFT